MLKGPAKNNVLFQILRELAFFLLRGCVNWLSFNKRTTDRPTDLTATNRQKDRKTDRPTLRLREVPVAPNKGGNQLLVLVLQLQLVIVLVLVG